MHFMAHLVASGDSVLPLQAAGSSRDPSSTALQPVVRAKYLSRCRWEAIQIQER